MQNLIVNQTQSKVDSFFNFKIQEKAFSSNLFGWTFYAEKISKDRKNFHNVLFSQNITDKEENNIIIMAPYAKIYGSVKNELLNLTFFNGTMLNSDTTKNKFFQSKYKELKLNLLKIFQKNILGKTTLKKDYRYYNLYKLRKHAQEIKSDSKKNHKNIIKVDFLYYSRLLLPLLIIALAIIGMLLGLFNPRTRNNFSFLYSLLVAILFLALISSCKSAVYNGSFTPAQGALITPVVFNALALLMLFKRSRTPLYEGLLSFKR